MSSIEYFFYKKGGEMFFFKPEKGSGAKCMAFKIMFLGYRLWIFIEELPRHLRETRNWKLETRRSIAEIP